MIDIIRFDVTMLEHQILAVLSRIRIFREINLETFERILQDIQIAIAIY
ncbi:MAG: hypothetical protein WBM86_04585 [Waterburya sp.]